MIEQGGDKMFQVQVYKRKPHDLACDTMHFLWTNFHWGVLFPITNRAKKVTAVDMHDYVLIFY